MPEEEVIPGLSFESLKQDNTTNEEEEDIPGLSFESLQTPDISTDNLKKKEDEVPEVTPLVQEGQEQSSPLVSQPADTGSVLPSSVETETPFSIPSFVPEEEKKKIEDYKKSLQEGTVPVEEQEQVDAYKAVIDQQGLTTERDINTFIDEVRNNPNILDDQRQKAELAALVKRDETVNFYKQEKQQRLADDLAWKIKTATESAESIPDYLRIEKNKLRQTLDENSIEYKESGFDKRISEIKNADNVKLAVRTATNTLPNNARVKIKSLTTDEEREAYKQELLENINRSNKATGNHFSEFDIKSYSTNLEDLARFSSALESVEAKVAQVQGEKNVFLEETKFKELNKEIDDLNDKLINDADLSDAERKSLEKAVSQRKMLKESFINNDGEKASEFVFSNIKENSDNFNLFKEALSKVPKDLTPKEQFEMFYLALRKTAAETYDKAFPERLSAANLTRGLREYLNWSKVPILDIPLPEGEFNLTETEEDAYELKTMVEGLSKIYFSNNAYTEDEGGFFEAAMGKFREYFYPKSASFRGVSSFRKTQEDVATALSETGIAEADIVDKEKINAFVDVLANVDSFKEEAGATLGTSLGMMTELAAGSGILKGVGATAKMDVFLKSILGEGRVSKLLNSAIQEGVKAEFSGEIFNKKDELEFKQFFAGQVASDVIEKTLAKTGALKFATFLFKGLGLKPQIAIDAAGKIFSRAQGEFAEESMQQIVQAYSQTENGKSFVENLRAMFPDLDSVGEFYVMTTVMGGVFGIKGAHSDIAKKLEEGGYDLGEAKKAVGALMNDVRAAAKNANQKVAETKEPESAVEYKEPIVEEKEGEDTEYKDAEGKFFSEEEVLNMTPEEMSGMVIVNPSQAVSDKLSKKQEEDVQAKETEDKTEEVVETPVTESDEETTTQAVEAEKTTEPVTETKTTEPVTPTTEKKQDISFQKGVAESIGENVEDLSDVSEGSVKVTVGDTDLILNQSEDGNLVVDSIETQEGKKGQGSAEKAMDAVIQKANELGVDVELKVAPKEGTDTDTERLTDFYERKGFRSVGDGKMVKEPEPVVTTSELTQEQKNRNTVVSMKNEYNKLSPAKKKTKAGQEMLSNIIKLARENDLELAQKDGGKIDLINKKTGKSASVVGAKRTMSSPTQRNIERTKQAIREGVFLYGGGYNQRVDVGLTRKEINDGVRDVEAGKYETESAKKLIDAVRKAHLEGGYTYMSGSGALIDRVFVPIQTSADEQQLKDEYGFTDEEIRMLNEEQESLAKEFDEWFMSQNEEVQNKIIENNEKQDGEQSGQAEQDTEGAKGENDVDGKKEQKQDGGESKSEGGDSEDRFAGVKERLSNPNLGLKKKVKQHLKTLLKSKDVSEEVKDKIVLDSDNMYDPMTNAWSQAEAAELVFAFSNIEGGLEDLIKDVDSDPLSYGGIFPHILAAAQAFYQKDYMFDKAAEVAKIRIQKGHELGRNFQALGAAAGTLMDSPFEAAQEFEKDVKSDRDEKLNKKDLDDESGKTAKEYILDSKPDIDEVIKAFTDSLESGNETAKKFIDEAIKKAKKAGKTDSESKSDNKKLTEKAKKHRDAIRKLKEENKKNKGKFFYSSVIPGVTPEGIEYIVKLAKEYIGLGFTNSRILAKKIKESLKDTFDVDVNTSDIEKAFNKKDENGNSVFSDLKSISLSDKIVNYVSTNEKSKTTEFVVDFLENLFAKAKETIPVEKKSTTKVSYIKKMIEAMKEQDIARNIWDKSKNQVLSKLEKQVAEGKITEAERAKILSDLDYFFEDKVGAPFSKGLVDKAIKESLKNENESILEIVKKHYSVVEKGGQSIDESEKMINSLAAKITSNTGLTPEQATELEKIIKEQVSIMMEPAVEKALAKALGLEGLSEKELNEVKEKNRATIKDIIDAVNLGALNEESYLNAFGKAFGFATVSKHDKAKISSFVYDIFHLPENSTARDKAFIDFRTYLDDLKKGKQTVKELFADGLAKTLFYQHVLGSHSTVLRGIWGIMNTSLSEAIVSRIRNPRLFAKMVQESWSNPEDTLKRWGSSIAISRMIIQDALKRGYIPYESALDGIKHSKTVLNYLDKLANSANKDLTFGEKVFKYYEWLNSKHLRVLMAVDAVAHYQIRRRYLKVGVYNKMLTEGRSPKEKDFWKDFHEAADMTKERLDSAITEAENEYKKLEAKGVDVSNFNIKQRAHEIVYDKFDKNTKSFAERMSTQMRLGHHPKGTFGLVYDLADKALRRFPFSEYFIPFLKIPLNMTDSGIDYFPLLGLYRAIVGRGVLIRKFGKENEAFLEKIRGKKEFIVEDRPDVLIKQMLGGAVLSIATYAVVSQAGLKDDDPDKKFQVVYKGAGSSKDNENLNIKPFHYRIRMNDDTWGPWLDYRDSPLFMVFAFAGSLSDYLNYNRDTIDSEFTEDDVLKGMKIASGSSIMIAKEQNFVQSINEALSTLRADEGVINALGKWSSNNLARSIKSTVIPSAYTNYPKVIRGIAHKNEKRRADYKDSFSGYFFDILTKDIPIVEDYREDYVDGLGQTRLSPNVAPFLPDSYERENYSYLVNTLRKNTNLKEEHIAPVLGDGMKFVFAEGINMGKEIPHDKRDKLRDIYRASLKEAYDENVFPIMDKLKSMEDKTYYKKYLHKIQESVKKQVMNSDYGKKVLIVR